MSAVKNNIAFVTGFSGKRPAGLERFLIELLKAMDILPEASSVTVYTKKGNGLKEALEKEKIHHIQVQEIGFGKLWKDIGLFFAPKANLYIFNGPQVPLFFIPKKYAVLTYDFAYRQVTAQGFGEKIKIKITDMVTSLAFHRAQLIFTLSQTIKKEVQEIFHIDEKKIEPMYSGFLDVCKMHAAEAMPFSFERFFLFVSTLKERKNVLGVIQGFHYFLQSHPSDTHLVIAGKYSESAPYFQTLHAFVQKNNLQDRVHFVGHISDNQLSWLYQKAIALVSPSFVEGFGLPLLEAFICRLPVITSANSCQSEITADAALLVNPHQPQEIGEAMQTLLTEPDARSHFIEKGMRRAQDFSWEKSAQLFFSLLKRFF